MAEMIETAVAAFVASVEATGAQVTRVNLSGPIDSRAWTVAELITHLQSLPQGWRVLVPVSDGGDGATLYPVNGWEAGGGEVYLLIEDDEGEP